VAIPQTDPAQLQLRGSPTQGLSSHPNHPQTSPGPQVSVPQETGSQGSPAVLQVPDAVSHVAVTISPLPSPHMS
jgi:hypothetical protein